MRVADRIRVHTNPAYDLFCSMIRVENNQAFTPVKGANTDIVEWANSTMEMIPDDIRHLLSLFFNLETSYGMSLAGYVSSWGTHDVPAFLERLAKVPAENLLQRFIYTGIGPGRDMSSDDVKGLMCDDKLAFEFINQHLSFAPQDKWQMLQFLLKPEDMKRDLLRLINWFYNTVYREIENTQHRETVQAEKDLRDRLTKYGEEYLKLLLPIDYSKRRDAQVTLAISYYQEKSSSINILDDLYIMGYRYIERAESKHAILAGTQVFKALADETRLNIIRLLADRPWYGHEIAQKLNISNSTVSHHVAMLCLHGLAQTYREENKVYFSLEKEAFKQVIFRAVERVLEEAP